MVHTFLRLVDRVVVVAVVLVLVACARVLRLERVLAWATQLSQNQSPSGTALRPRPRIGKLPSQLQHHTKQTDRHTNIST